MNKPPAPTRADCLARAAGHFDGGRLLAELRQRVAMPTESDGGGNLPALQAYLRLHMQPALQALGFDCQIHPNPQPGAPPLLLAHRVEGAHLPTVLTYGHGDVVNGQAGQWRQGMQPWDITVEGGKWHGRGSADNKGQHTINLLGLEAAIHARGGRLGYNVTALIEMGEEAASPGLRGFCAAHARELAAQLFIASDGPRLQAGRPTLFLGSRGAVNFTLRMNARERACHSGNWGGVLRNPATRIAHAIACMVDARGRLLVDGLRAPPMSAAVRQALHGLPVGGGEHDPAIDDGWGETGHTAAERLMGCNTLEVLALGGGDAQRPVNAIPAQALAHCQLRFVAGTPWQRLQAILRAHLNAHGFDDVDIAIGLQGAASRMEPDHPWVRWAAQSIAQSCGQAPHVLPNLAGSLPNDIFADLLGLPTLWVPHAHPACNQHAPNEHLLASAAREGLQIMAGLYWDLGEANAAPWPQAAR